MLTRNAYRAPTIWMYAAGAAALGCFVALVVDQFVTAATLCVTALAFGAIAADRFA